MIHLTCPKCSRKHPITDDDAVFFYPRFFCLACGEKIQIPIKPEEYVKLSKLPDRDRSVNGQKPKP